MSKKKTTKKKTTKRVAKALSREQIRKQAALANLNKAK